MQSKVFIYIIRVLVLSLIAGFIVWNLQRTSKVSNIPFTENQEEVVGEALEVVVSPLEIRQGDPALITIKGLATTTVSSLIFNRKRVGVFNYEGRASALIGIDLRMSPGTYSLELNLSDGTKLEEKLVISPREIAQAPLGIPEKLGGNTTESERELISTLVQEGALISAVSSADTKLWDGPFRLPLNPPIVVTDTYGYSRITGASTISHKGTDFRAVIGTPVYAMNSGTVQFTRNLRNYGNTIIIDHGLGLHTVYMHLSEIGVKLGQKVDKGEIIGKTGETGYVFGPHLHLTVRIGGISIDPEKFLGLFGE
ncbi:MAG: M23 family metallopeptidase [Candidatus Zambryskibacteria bacterium]|nr:M23 family metallopeptidase [Candidatus Zambryskibacteria bacterium]